MDETKRAQVEALGRLKWSLRRIEAETGVRRETASKYLQAAGIDVRAPGWRGRRPCVAGAARASPAKPAIEVSPDYFSKETPITGAVGAKPAMDSDGDSEKALGVRGDGPPARVTLLQSACEAHREYIASKLGQGRCAKLIWQDLVDAHGFRSGYASVMRFARKLRPESAHDEPCAIIETLPGEEAQVDYAGDGPLVRDSVTGKYRRARLFCMTLGWSRKSVRLVAWKSSSAAWANLHERAFREMGAVPRLIVLDNLREGVLTPDIYDAALNPIYRAMLAHYGAPRSCAGYATRIARARSKPM